MSAFAAAIDALFSDPNLGAYASYRVAGEDPAVPVRAIARQPDLTGPFGDTRVHSATAMLDIRISDVAVPAEGDTIQLGSTVYVIQGAPVRDTERLVWTVEARPQ
jgi:hypothetical protein